MLIEFHDETIERAIEKAKRRVALYDDAIERYGDDEDLARMLRQLRESAFKKLNELQAENPH